MDVKFPNRAAAAATGRPATAPTEPTNPAPQSQATSMTVHEPPKTQGDPMPPAPAKAEQAKPEAKPAADKPQKAPEAHLKPGATQGGAKPTGVIVATVFVMIVLIGLTVMAYISSNS